MQGGLLLLVGRVVRLRAARRRRLLRDQGYRLQTTGQARLFAFALWLPNAICVYLLFGFLLVA